MKMHRIYILLLLALTFINCEKVVDVDLQTIAPKLIIDANFEVYFDENPIAAKNFVKLTLSTNYYDENIPIVTNASVFVTNLSDNTIINFNDTNLDGIYEPNINFIPQDNISYELTVIYNNQTYKGTATKVKSTSIKNIVQGDKTLFAGTETEVKVNFQDNVSEDNYYLFDFTNTQFLAIEDRFFNGSDYNFSFFYQEDEITLPTTVTIKMSGITKDYFTYFRVLLDQSGQAGGGPFETIPASLLGNMVNITDANNFPLGYFHISETDTFTLNLVEKN